MVEKETGKSEVCKWFLKVKLSSFRGTICAYGYFWWVKLKVGSGF